MADLIARTMAFGLAAEAYRRIKTVQDDNRYRIEERNGGYEAQMRYTAGKADGEFWYPLLPNGYWAEPDAFSHGRITFHVVFNDRGDAERAIVRAQAINGTNIRDAAQPPSN